MNKSIYLGLAAAALVAAGCGNKGGGGSAGGNSFPGGGNTLATVNGEAISMGEMGNYLTVKPTVRIVDGNGNMVQAPVADTLAFQALQDLVTQEVLLQLAEEDGVLPTDQEVEDELKFKSELEPSYMQVMKQRGLELAQIKRSIKLELARENLVTKGITVPAADVDKFIADNQESFREPAKAYMQLLFVTSEEAKNAANADLQSGSSYEEVIRKHSQAPAQLANVFEASQVQGTPIAQLNETFRGAIGQTAVGEMTDWIQVEGAFARIKVLNKTEEKDVEITEARKKFIQRQMAVDRGSQANDLEERLAAKLKDAQIEVKNDSLAEPWKEYESRIKEAAESSALSTGSGQDNPAGTTGG